MNRLPQIAEEMFESPSRKASHGKPETTLIPCGSAVGMDEDEVQPKPKVRHVHCSTSMVSSDARIRNSTLGTLNSKCGQFFFFLNHKGNRRLMEL